MKRFAPGFVCGLAITVCVASGCAGARAASSEDQPLFAAGWSGPPPRVNVLLAGPDASSDKQARCRTELTRAGAVVDEAGPAWALLRLQAGGNRLQVTTRRRGLVRDEPRPDQSVERLCNDALYALVVALRGEDPGVRAESANGPSLLPPSHVEPTTPPYSGMPGQQDRSRDVPADQPLPPPAASGAINQGPIQP
jgi:hypothetical protein